MGRSFVDAHPVARRVFDQANDILGFDLAHLCFEGPEDELNDTVNTQPALYVCGVAIFEVLRDYYPNAAPQLMAGHSLGEFTALTAAGALSFADGVRLVRKRGRLMKQAGEQHPGAMAAILGLDTATVHKICREAQQQTDGDLVVANDNTVGQVVISGHEAALEIGMKLARDAGARKVVKLAVSIASHSPLMASVDEAFREALSDCVFSEPQVPVYANVTAQPLVAVDAIRDELTRQLTSPVLWTDTMRQMIGAGVTTIVELGPKDVLCGLMKRFDRQVQRIPLSTPDNLRYFELDDVSLG